MRQTGQKCINDNQFSKVAYLSILPLFDRLLHRTYIILGLYDRVDHELVNRIELLQKIFLQILNFLPKSVCPCQGSFRSGGSIPGQRSSDRRVKPVEFGGQSSLVRQEGGP